MIELKNDTLHFSFPEVHKDAHFSLDFQRTLRIPDDNQTYPLPPGFGGFPLFHVDDYKQKVPGSWIEHGGVFMPMYQSEALWIYFDGDYPFAVKIATGKINAVSGDDWSEVMVAAPEDEFDEIDQDYLVIPDQPWLDGYSVGQGQIRQFVAMPLGEGYTAEEQLTGSAETGGIQIIAYPMKGEVYEKLQSRPIGVMKAGCECADLGMGLAPGGLMSQQIYEDEYGLDVWDTSISSRCFVHIVNSQVFSHITGKNPPAPPLSAQDYTKAGLPWFDYYDDSLSSLNGSDKLAGLDSVAAKGIKKGEAPLKENKPVSPTSIKMIKKSEYDVREGDF
jgi:hypothetical protein